MTVTRPGRRLLLIAMGCPLLLACQLTAATTPAKPSDDVVVAAMRATFDKTYRDDAPGAVLLVAKGDRVVLRTARGMSDIGRRTSLEAGDVFRIGSISKHSPRRA